MAFKLLSKEPSVAIITEEHGEISRKTLKITSLDISIMHNDSGNIIQGQDHSGLRVYGQWMEGISSKVVGTRMLGTHSPDLINFYVACTIHVKHF